MEQYDAARALFSRLVTLKLGNKPIKAAFKKWLAFEKEHGTTKSQNEVKAAARDYVQRAIDQNK
jgi:rRNA biogenesis protein RRP5